MESNGFDGDLKPYNYNNIIYSKFMFLIPFVCGIYTYFVQNRYIKRVLAYNNEPVQIYQSTFELNAAEGIGYNFITCGSLEEIHNILDILVIKEYILTLLNTLKILSVLLMRSIKMNMKS